MADALCLDAGVLLKLVLAEPGSEDAEELVAEALRGEADLVGPAFLMAEALSVLRGRARRRQIASEEADEAADYLLALPLAEVSGPKVYRRAWEIAGQLGLPTVYDAVYLAVAENRGAAFWTADRALFDRAKGLGYVRMLVGIA